MVACILFGLFLPVTTPSWAKFKYWLSVFLALAFVFFSVVYIGSILAKFTTTARSGDISSLGFATIFEGTYVKDQQQEWILSLTAPSKPTTVTPVKVGGTPPPAAGEKPVVINGETVQRSGETVQGLGAPLWVLFLGVFGAAMFTINMIANEIKNPPDFNAIASPDLHNRIQVIVQQQIFCFFAPVVGIFVYQFLVVAGAASQPVTVGVTALGAGATLSFLLARAGKDATDTIDEGAKSQPNKRGGAGSGGVGS